MAISNRKSFFSGMAVGCVTAVLLPLFLLAAASLVALYVPSLNAMVMENATRRLQAPPLPAVERFDYAGFLRDSENREVPFSDFEGQVAIFHFWQPECTSCLAELPTMRALHDAIDARGLPVALVSIAVGKTENLPEIIDNYGLTHPVYRIEGKIPPPFHTEHTPATYIVNQQGDVLVARTGSAKWDDPTVMHYLERISLGDTAE